MKIECADNVNGSMTLFHRASGGSIPTSAHQIVVDEITRERAAWCYGQWHYLGETKFISTRNYGAFFNGILYGAITYGAPNATELDGYFDRYTQDGWFEIKRLALSPSLPKNSESRFIAVSLRLLKKSEAVRGVVTYADSGVGHVGTIYKAAGFDYKGLTAPKSDYVVHGKIQQRGKTKRGHGEWKPRSRKHLFVKVIHTPTPSPS
jgi:hypothetical protein